MGGGAGLAQAAATGASATSTAVGASSSLSKWYAMAQVLQGVSQIASGFSAQSAYNAEAAALQRQSDMALEEARLSGEQKAREVRKFSAEQNSIYNKSGVTLEGSPALVLAETESQGQQEVNALLRRGEAQAQLLRMQASAAKRSGRSALFGSLIQAGIGGLSGLIQSKSLGLYGQKAASMGQTLREPAGLDYSFRNSTALNYIQPRDIRMPVPTPFTTGSLG